MEVEGKKPLRMALAYGFRNIQNIVQKLKRGKCPYDFVEIMACPGGCNNGGGQLRPEEGEDPKDLLARVNDLYRVLPSVDPVAVEQVEALYRDWLGGSGSEKSQQMLHTKYHAVEKMTSALTIKW